MQQKNKIDPIDEQLGRLLREARLAAGLTQSELGKTVGLTFQQMQKYENGKNRISSSRLYRLASHLGMSVQWFFEGLDDQSSFEVLHGVPSLFSRNTLELVRCCHLISNEGQRRTFLELIRSISGETVQSKTTETGEG